MSFASLKQSSALETLVKKLESQSSYGNRDERFWEPTQDKKSGLGSAIIRFLPTSPDSDAPWVQTFRHGFQNEATGKWFVADCPTSFGGECPVCDHVKPLWKGSEADKAIARARGRKGSYISNIMVIKDPANPENNGKLFLFKYGKQIFDKIIQKIKPDFEDDRPVNVFDFWKGADFNLRITLNEGGFRSYEKSFFSDVSAFLGGDDGQLEALWNTQHSLKEFIDPTKFDTVEKLKERFDSVVSGVAPSATSAANRVLDQMNASAQPSFGKQESRPTQHTELPEVSTSTATSSTEDWESLLEDL